MLAGCASSSGNVPLGRSLPPAPGFAREAAVADPRVGESALTVAARERAGRLQANATIRRLNAWYGEVRRGYGGQ